MSALVVGHAQAIVRLVVSHPGRTAKELAELPECELDHVQIDRRAKELEQGGWIVRSIFSQDDWGLRMEPTEKARIFVREAESYRRKIANALVVVRHPSVAGGAVGRRR